MLKQGKNKGPFTKKWYNDFKFLWSVIEWILSLFNLLLSVAYFKASGSIATTVTVSFNILLVMYAFNALFFLTYSLFYRLNLRLLHAKYFKTGHCPFRKKGIKTHTGFYMKLVLLYYFVQSLFTFVVVMIIQIDFFSFCYYILYLYSSSVSVPLIIVYSFIFECQVDYYEEELNKQFQAFNKTFMTKSIYYFYQQQNDQWRGIHSHLHKLNILVERLFNFFGPLIAVLIAFYFVAITLTLYSAFTISGLGNFFLSIGYAFMTILPMFYFTNRPTYIINLVS